MSYCKRNNDISNALQL